jgi:hypothetical protein
MSVSSPIQLIEVKSRRDFNLFVELPWKIYAGDPLWVPRLRLEMKDLFSPQNPFFQVARIRSWLAKKNGEVVGRITGIIYDEHNKFHQEKCAFFGFYEATNDSQVAEILFSRLEEYAREEGMDTIRGPMNFSTNHDCGLLIEGPADPPQMMMPYNPLYYRQQIENFGYQKAMDLLAYRRSTHIAMPEKIQRIADRTEKSKNITYRPLNKKEWAKEMDKMFSIYNDAWEKNWGFVPFRREEFDYVAKQLKTVVESKLVIYVDVGGESAGFAVALPDYNQVFKRIPNGKLFPTGIFKLLNARRYINRIRVITLGIRHKFQHLGLGGLMYRYLERQSKELGYDEGELSWILENNTKMNSALVTMGAEAYKRYRIFEKKLTP